MMQVPGGARSAVIRQVLSRSLTVIAPTMKRANAAALNTFAYYAGCLSAVSRCVLRAWRKERSRFFQIRVACGRSRRFGTLWTACEAWGVNYLGERTTAAQQHGSRAAQQ